MKLFNLYKTDMADPKSPKLDIYVPVKVQKGVIIYLALDGGYEENGYVADDYKEEDWMDIDILNNLKHKKMAIIRLFNRPLGKDIQK